VLAPAAVRRLAAALLGASLGATVPAGTAIPAVAAAPVAASWTATTSAGRMTGDPVASDPMARDRLGGGVPSAAWPLAPREGAAGGGTAVDTATSTAAGGGTAAGASTSAGTSSSDDGAAGAADGTSPGTDATAPDAAWTPSPPDRTPVPDPDALHLLSRAPEAGTLVDEGLVVRRGDTLWSIAARSLGPGATADEIAREWPRWHEANRHTIGNDPDLIRPGQVLLPPAP
jgi:nucleoid-associated protein YgaU